MLFNEAAFKFLHFSQLLHLNSTVRNAIIHLARCSVGGPASLVEVAGPWGDGLAESWDTGRRGVGRWQVPEETGFLSGGVVGGGTPSGRVPGGGEGVRTHGSMPSFESIR